MTRQRFSFLLILLMVITPVASAFDHCSGMNMPGHLSESQNMIIADIVDKASTSSHQNTDQGLNQNQSKMHCHISGNCTFHVCGAYGILASTLLRDFIASYSYSSFVSILPYSTAFSPEIRPPILIL